MHRKLPHQLFTGYLMMQYKWQRLHSSKGNWRSYLMMLFQMQRLCSSKGNGRIMMYDKLKRTGEEAVTVLFIVLCSFVDFWVTMTKFFILFDSLSWEMLRKYLKTKKRTKSKKVRPNYHLFVNAMTLLDMYLY
jgi:hypothetical protein